MRVINSVLHWLAVFGKGCLGVEQATANDLQMAPHPNDHAIGWVPHFRTSSAHLFRVPRRPGCSREVRLRAYFSRGTLPPTKGKRALLGDQTPL